MSKLLVVIIDGLCSETLACAHVPSLDGLASRGVQGEHLQPQHAALTLPNLISLCTSLPPEEHGVLSNSGSAILSPLAIPLFSLLRYRQQNIAAFYSSDRLRNIFPMGSLQTGVLINSQSIRNVDQELSQQAARHLQREKPDCCLLYLEGPNITGTHFGFSSEPYLEAVEQAASSISVIMEHLAFVGAEQEYCTLVIGCCGAAAQQTEADCRSPILLSGPGVLQGRLEEKPLSLLDLTPTMASLLNVAPHPDWRGRTLAEWFHPKMLDIRSFSTKSSSYGSRREHPLAA
jgi:predicted AlkP superfamily pyrophosphatase or phosphodiesterase